VSAIAAGALPVLAVPTPALWPLDDGVLVSTLQPTTPIASAVIQRAAAKTASILRFM
jgi:hypothetical protein